MTMPHLENCNHSEEGWCLDCVKKQSDELDYAEIVNAKVNRENELLRQALKSCRKAVCEKSGYGRLTTREFAKACGVTPTQISEWTAELILDPPDFVCRNNDFIAGIDDRRQDNA
jgi:hypothetical protein